MAYPPASGVPIPELIRRGYDRAKGLGHEGLDAVRDDHRRFLASLRGVEPAALPANTDQAAPHVVFHPGLLASLYAPGDRDDALGALMGVLSGHTRMSVTHPWLKEAVAAFQSAGHDVRTVALWIATMTVLPRWGAPAALPDTAGHLSAAESATLAAAIDALEQGPVCLVVPEGPLAQFGAGMAGIQVTTAR